MADGSVCARVRRLPGGDKTVRKEIDRDKIAKTNADRCVGADAVVTEEINNLKAQGQVKVLGNVWTARAAEDAVIPEGTVVTVEKWTV